MSANAATINSTAGDAAGKSSFFTGEIFGGPPTAGNDYVMIQSRMLRTPDFSAKAATNLVFQGDSLSIGNATWTAGQFALKTVYTDDSKRAVVTINDFRLYNSVVNMASEGKGCIAGNITVYGTPTYPAKFQCSTAGKRLFEIASTITGATGTKILFEKATDTSELRMTGDMSGYLGALETTAAGGRLVLACPYAAATTQIGQGTPLSLGPNFSYVGTGTMALPSGTRFVAGYDAAEGTTVPVTLDATHFTLADGPFEVALDGASFSAAVDYLGYAGKTLPVAKIPRALREVAEADFVDATTGAPTSHNLPDRIISVENGQDGIQTVSLVTIPVVTLSNTVGSANPGRANGWWLVTDATAWIDGSAPTSDKDYLVARGVANTFRTSTGSPALCTFTGRSLTLAATMAHKNGAFRVDDFRLGRNSLINAAGAGSSGGSWQAISGGMRLLSTSWDQPAYLTGSAAHFIDLQSTLTGGGTLMFKVYDGSATAITDTRARISGDNSAFTGQLRLYSYYCEQDKTNEAQVLEFDAPENLGGAPAAFDYRALGIGKGCSLAPRKPMTLDMANRGIFVDTLGRLIVTNGTFGIRQPIRMTGTIRKEGPGVLALGGDVTFGSAGTDAPTGANNMLDVAEGGIQPLTTNGFARLAISFGEGTRLIADAAAEGDVRVYGLLNSYGPFTLPADGKLHVRIVGDSDESEGYSVTLCTVTPTAAAALAENIAVDTLTRRSVSIRSEPVDVGGTGLVRFLADVRMTGCTVIIR